MWDIATLTISPDRFQPFQPEEVLYDFDGPRIFTLRGADQERYLVYWSDGNDEFNRYVVVPTSTRILKGLKAGELSVLDALDQPHSWLCDVSHANQLLECHRVEFAAIPSECLPAAGTLLLPGLQAPLTAQAVGHRLRRG